MIFLNPELKEKMLNGEARGIHYIPIQLLKGDLTNDQIYYESFIKNSNKLLKYEMNYQIEKGDLTAVSKCFQQLLKNEREITQQRYIQEQRYKYGRNYSDIGNKFSIKEVAIQIAQKASPRGLDRVVEFVNLAQRALKGRKRKIENEKTNSIEGFGLALEDVIVEEIPQFKKWEDSGITLDVRGNSNPNIDLEDPYTTSKANGNSNPNVDLDDPYTTR